MGKKRIEIDVPLDAFLLISIGELNNNKNNSVIVSAMASGLLCIVGQIRGNTDLVMDDIGGFFCDLSECGDHANAIDALCSNLLLCAEMSRFNKTKIREYDTSVVEKLIEYIYTEVLGD